MKATDGIMWKSESKVISIFNEAPRHEEKEWGV
jgi:hypothetical protein